MFELPRAPLLHISCRATLQCELIFCAQSVASRRQQLSSIQQENQAILRRIQEASESPLRTRHFTQSHLSCPTCQRRKLSSSAQCLRDCAAAGLCATCDIIPRPSRALTPPLPPVQQSLRPSCYDLATIEKDWERTQGYMRRLAKPPII